ncbi:tetratricopeptide repeat protein [Fulvivirga sp. RKSG066]|uniref:tetratricopeptide repeat-containing sensor histidine kinase n=1 Tax=Fulvivirga aurantia TaxID=2529383 RepID=UPI0012BCEE2B|nr:tetratricopeptide repeat protein [Fulvivirga aurantia]MTI22650.1 tetratricopeptide repeat protein [Fulvivirga aurantia]
MKTITGSLFCFLFLLLFTTHLSSQPSSENHKNTYTATVFIADSLVRDAQIEQARKHYQKALQLATLHLSDQYKSEALLNLADFTYQTGEFNLSHSYYKRSISLTDHPTLKAQALQGIAHILWRAGDNVKAITSIIESIELYTSAKDTLGIIKSSNILAGIYMSKQKLTEAEEIYDEMLQLAITQQDTLSIASNYGYKGVVSFFRKDYQKAINLYRRSLDLNLAAGEFLEAAISYGNIGEAFGKLNLYDSATTYFNKALEVQSEHRFLSLQIFIYYSLGEIKMLQGKYASAHSYYLQSLDIIKQTGEYREKPHVYRLIAQNYKLQGQYKKALSYYENYSVTKDSLFDANKNQQLEEIRAKYDFDKKEQENYFLAQQNADKEIQLSEKQTVIRRQNVLSGLLVLLLALSLFLLFKLYKNRQLLSKANNTKDKLFGFIAHDLRTPLGNIKALTDLLSPLEEPIIQEDQELMWEHLHQSSNTALTLLNDMLSWSITQQQGFNFQPKAVNLRRVVEQTLSLFNYQIQKKLIDLQTDVPSDIEVFADQDVVATITRNLIANAVKFTYNKGKIEITAVKHDKYVQLNIKDSGIGMTQDKINMIMSANNIKSTRGTSNEKGIGLGLKLSREFAKESNGKIKIESTPNEGTQVSVQLPAVVAE